MAGKPGRSGGRRPGQGRPVGSRNKATIERAVIAEQVVARAEMTGRKLAKEILDEFMHLFAGMAMASAAGPEPDEARFEKWGRLAVACAKDLASYQSPTFRAIEVRGGEAGNGGGVIRFVIENGPVMIDAVVND